MGRLLKYLRPYKWQAGVSFVAILLKAACDVVGPYLFKVGIDSYLTSKRPDHPSWLARHLSPNAITGITQLAGLYLAALLLIFLFEFVQTYLIQWMGQKVMFDLRSQIFRHIQGMHIAFFDRNPVGRLVTRLTSDVDALNEMFTSGVFAIFDDVFVLAGIVFIMLQMNWKLALLAFAVLPLIGGVTMIFRKHVRSSYRRIRSAIARINAFTQEHISGMTVVQLFNREQRAFNDFEAVNRQHMVAFKDAILAYALYYPAVEILSTVAIALVLWRGGNGVLKGTVTVGVLVAFLQYGMRFFRPIQDLSDKYNILQAAMASSERVFKLLDTPAGILAPAAPQEVPATLAGIEFDHVWFAYKEEDWVLRDVSFRIAPGETIAIVGHTGAGKTTIISLLLRFYDVQRGAIRVGGVDIREVDPLELRRHFGVVLQDPYLFTGTIEDNIRLGTGGIEREDVEEAAEQVNLMDFIRSL